MSISLAIVNVLAHFIWDYYGIIKDFGLCGATKKENGNYFLNLIFHDYDDILFVLLTIIVLITILYTGKYL